MRKAGAFPEFTRVLFASPHDLSGMSRLSVLWLQPGIALEGINPGGLKHNRRHQWIRLILRGKATRPHQALDGKYRKTREHPRYGNNAIRRCVDTRSKAAG